MLGSLPQHVGAHWPRSSLVEVDGPNKILESFPHAYTFDRLLVFRAQKDGVISLGHIKSAQDNMIFLVLDLKENLAIADQFVVDLNQEIDQLIVEKNIDA